MLNRVTGSTLLSAAKTAYLELFNTRRQQIYCDPPVVSFTFDDVPLSAFENGAQVLNAAGVRGTFYVSLKIELSKGAFVSAEEAMQLSEGGHTVGCHTRSHYSLYHGSVSGLAADAYQNRMELGSILGRSVDHFSYPFGEVSLGAKKALGQSYVTLRGVRRGINWGVVDLNLLRTIPIYNDSFSEKQILTVLKTAAKLKGWVIFYTHGVTDRPGEYDSSPTQLQSVISIAQQEGFRILTLDEVSSSYL